MQHARVSLFLAALALGAPSRAAAGDEAAWDPEAGWFTRPAVYVPIEHVLRPLNTPRRYFLLYFDASWTRYSPRRPVVEVNARGSYGIDDDLEAGAHFIEWSFSPHPETGLSLPTGFVRYRLLDGPVFELAAEAELELPLGPLRFQVGAPALVHVGDLGRVDAGVFYRGQGQDGRWRSIVTFPLDLSLQVIPRLAVTVGGSISLHGLDAFDELETRANARVRVSLSFPSERFGAFADVGLSASTPDLLLGGGELVEPALGTFFSVLLDVRFFLFAPREDRDIHM